MKQLIVLAAVLPILLLFMAQYCLDQKNSRIMNEFQQQVYTAKERAKQEGCFSEEIVEDLRRDLAETLAIEESDIAIEATAVKQYRLNYFDGGERGMIRYKVSVPVDKVMVGGNLLGIGEEENRALYTVEGTTASECLP